MTNQHPVSEMKWNKADLVPSATMIPPKIYVCIFILNLGLLSYLQVLQPCICSWSCILPSLVTPPAQKPLRRYSSLIEITTTGGLIGKMGY